MGLIKRINKRTMPNKSVPMGKILKINNRTGTFIWQSRVSSYESNTHVTKTLSYCFNKIKS